MRPVVKRWSAAALATSITGLVAVLPAAPASAKAQTASVGTAIPTRSVLASPSTETTTYQVSEWLSGSQLSQLLSQLPIHGPAGALSPELLSGALAQLPALQALELGHLQEALQQTLEGLGTESTLHVLEEPQAVEQLASTLETEIKNLLSTSELNELLSRFSAGGSLSAELEEALSKVRMPEVLGKLLGKSESPAALLTGLLGSLPAESVQSTLGGTVEGASAHEETVQELSEQLQTNPEALASEVGMSPSQLPSTAPAMTAPLSSGKTLGTVDGTAEAAIGMLNKVLGSEEGTGSKEESSGSTGGASGSGSGSSSTGSSSQATGPTVIVNMGHTGSSHTKGSTHHRRRIRVLRHKMHRRVLRILVKTPGAGRIVLRGHRIRNVRRHVGKARRMWLRVRLSKAGVAALRRMHARARRRRRHPHSHHRRTVWLRPRVVFMPRHGRRSHAVVRVRH